MVFSGFRSQLYALQSTFCPRRVRVADTLQQEVSPSGTVRPACVCLHSGRCPLQVGNRGGFLIIIIECPFWSTNFTWQCMYLFNKLVCYLTCDFSFVFWSEVFSVGSNILKSRYSTLFIRSVFEFFHFQKNMRSLILGLLFHLHDQGGAQPHNAETERQMLHQPGRPGTPSCSHRCFF